MTLPSGPLDSPLPSEKPQVRPTLQPAFTIESRRDWISGRDEVSRDLSIRSHVFTPTYAALHHQKRIEGRRHHTHLYGSITSMALYTAVA